ncbi:uncharacterized protein PG986_002671 [Apiospora aurea]|uniref:Uncharacterized protein n=1 Tax=Apiospora aurea TaxID=335848 RepID=A0ABR1QPJ0_9PEZI
MLYRANSRPVDTCVIQLQNFMPHCPHTNNRAVDRLRLTHLTIFTEAFLVNFDAVMAPDIDHGRQLCVFIDASILHLKVLVGGRLHVLQDMFAYYVVVRRVDKELVGLRRSG